MFHTVVPHPGGRGFLGGGDKNLPKQSGIGFKTK